MSSGETKPLLSTESGTSYPTSPSLLDTPPPYEEPARLAPYSGPPEGPPSYSKVTTSSSPTPSGQGQSMFVQCRVCQHIIHVSAGTQTRVVKCTSCSEATPIAPPPNGKKYVRCPCNCLLTCSDTASRVVCPRANCKRTIGVGTISVRPINADRIRVICGRCYKVILWPLNESVARCPHCRARSYLYPNWMRCRAISCLITGIVLIFLAIILFGSTFTWAEKHGGIFVLWIGGIFTGIGFLVRAGFYFAMTQSRVEP